MTVERRRFRACFFDREHETVGPYWIIEAADREDALAKATALCVTELECRVVEIWDGNQLVAAEACAGMNGCGVAPAC